MYFVVFKTIAECTSEGAITWTGFKDKKEFDIWYDKKMRLWYQVVEEGVSEEHALQLCSSPEAKLAVAESHLRKIEQMLCRI